jgi:hypothetical protein
VDDGTDAPEVEIDGGHWGELGALPASLLECFGSGRVAVERLLRFTAPLTTRSACTRIAMVG